MPKNVRTLEGKKRIPSSHPFPLPLYIHKRFASLMDIILKRESWNWHWKKEEGETKEKLERLLEPKVFFLLPVVRFRSASLCTKCHKVWSSSKKRRENFEMHTFAWLTKYWKNAISKIIFISVQKCHL